MRTRTEPWWLELRYELIREIGRRASPPLPRCHAAIRAVWRAATGGQASGGGSADRFGAVLGWLGVVVLTVGGQFARAEPDTPTPVPAEDTLAAPDGATPDVSVGAIQQRLSQVDELELDDAAKERLRTFYDEALRTLKEAESWAAQRVRFERMTQDVELRQAEVERDIADLAARPSISPPSDAGLEELSRRLHQAEQDLEKADATFQRLEEEPQRRAQRRLAVPSEIEEARQRLAEVNHSLSDPPDASLSAAEANARRAVLLARRWNLEQTLKALEAELRAYAATPTLLARQRDLAAIRKARAEDEVDMLRALSERRRKDEANDQLRRARLETARTIDSLQPIAASLFQDAERNDELTGRIEETSDALQAAKQTLEKLQTAYDRTRAQVQAVGQTGAIGMMLRKQRMTLPNVTEYEQAIATRQDKIRDLQLELFAVHDRRSAMADFEDHLQTVLDQVGPPPEGMSAEQFTATARELLELKREQLDTLLRNLNRRFDLLVTLDNAQQQLIRLVDEYRDYINQRVLWIRSAEMVGADDLSRATRGVAWLVAPDQGLELLGALDLGTKRAPLLTLLFALLFLVLLFWQRRMRRQIGAIAKVATQSAYRRFLPTLVVALLTLLIALPWPALLWFLAWLIGSHMQATPLARAVADALWNTGAVFFAMEFTRQACRPNGLADVHFEWPIAVLRIIRSNLRWLTTLNLPLVFIFSVMWAHGEQVLHESAGRAAFMLSMLSVILFAHLVLRPGGKLFRHLAAAGYDGWFYRLRTVWYGVGVLAPASLIVLSASGYYYTSIRLGVRMCETVFVPVILSIIGALFARWILIVRRRRAIERARGRVGGEGEGAATEGSTAIEGLPALSEPEVDLAEISRQTRRFVQSFLVLAGAIAIWLIWVDVLPALAVFDQMELWQSSVQTTEAVTNAAGGIEYRSVEKAQWITVADVAVALLVVLMTIVTVRNIAGLAELALPQQLQLDAGTRYAIATVARYSVVMLGVLWACAQLGVTWGKVQWLIAGISVGLGFGLQEIFSNFVSGLILLFEQPMRVGDIVTIEGTTGVVSRIQIRATTITNWERQELVVPNREFITGRLLNWTLGDQVNRVIITVGVAYGSDTDRARGLLAEIAAAHPNVLEDPAPMVNFEQFADSTLNLVLRAYLPNLDNRLATLSDLNTEIHKRFNAEGIEIAFPQRDLHIRSVHEPMVAPPSGNRS